MGDYQLWLREIVGMTAPIPDTIGALKTVLLEEGGKLAMDPRGRAWSFNLVEHEVVFPETRDLGKELVTRDLAIAKQLNLIASGGAGGDPTKLHALAAEQNLVLNELRTYLQNASLGKLFRRRVLPPSFDDRKPYVFMDKKSKQLQVNWQAVEKDALAELAKKK